MSSEHKPSATTLRLMACVESFAHQEEGAIGHDDWPALAKLLERELEVVARLATEAPSDDAALLARAQALRDRYAALSERIDAARQRAQTELNQLGESTRRLRDVRGAYGRREAGGAGSTQDQAA